MPLPTDARAAWPPRNIVPIYDDIKRWAAWYSGNPSQLDAAYGGTAPVGVSGADWVNRPSQFRGGVMGKVSRFFWGNPAPEGESQGKIHLPVAADIAAMSADLLFGEAPDITAPATASAVTQDQLDLYVEAGLFTVLREAAEIQAALGGVFLRVNWDTEVADDPFVTVHHPDRVVPEWRYNKLVAATIWSEVYRNNSTVVRWLERHEPGAIYHGVYEGTPTELGRAVPLADYPETAAFASLVNGDGAIVTGIEPLLTVVYVPNAKPNRIWRDLSVADNLGRSDFASTEETMDALDETWTSWMRDIRLGKARLIVPQSMLESAGPGAGGVFNADRELFTGLGGAFNPDETQLTQVQFAIRYAEHAATAQSLVEQVVRSAGYSMQTFSGETTGSGVTATEVSAREKRSLSTRDTKIGYWTPALTQVLQVMLAIDKVVFKDAVDTDKPSIDFPDTVSADPTAQATTLKTLSDAHLLSTETGVRMLHPDWDEDQIKGEVDALGAAVATQQLTDQANALQRIGTAAALGVDNATISQVTGRPFGGAPAPAVPGQPGAQPGA